MKRSSCAWCKLSTLEGLATSVVYFTVSSLKAGTYQLLKGWQQPNNKFILIKISSHSHIPRKYEVHGGRGLDQMTSDGLGVKP